MCSDKKLYLTDEQYLGILDRLQKRIEDNSPLVYRDSTTPGDKYTYCSWGLCSADKVIYPTPDLQLFPDHFPERISPKYTTRRHLCPFDKRDVLKHAGGCFYHCRIFRDGPVTREQALNLIRDTRELAFRTFKYRSKNVSEAIMEGDRVEVGMKVQVIISEEVRLHEPSAPGAVGTLTRLPYWMNIGDGLDVEVCDVQYEGTEKSCQVLAADLRLVTDAV